jgi:DNA-directed RNA polymerase subunit RPC12/RpoP
MFCSNCGREIADLPVACPFCNVKFVYVTKDKDSLGVLALLCFFIPLTGLILYLAWGETQERKSRSAANWGLAGFVFYMVAFIFCFQYFHMYSWLFDPSSREILTESQATEAAYNVNQILPQPKPVNTTNPNPDIPYENWLNEDLNYFGNIIFSKYKYYMSPMGERYPDSRPGADKEFMSKDWIANILGFSEDKFTRSEPHGDYKIVSSDGTTIIISGTNHDSITHSISMMAYINVRTNKIKITKL